MSYRQLEQACRDGKLSDAETLLRKLNQTQQRQLVQQCGDCPNKYTLLHWACHHGHQPVAEMLIEKGAGLEANDKNSWTPLHCACHAGHVEVATMLIGKGANVMNQGLPDYSTPLHLACENGHTAVAEMLLGRGADLEARNKMQWTPLHVACYHGRMDVAEMLIDKGADKEAKGHYNRTPLHCACTQGHLAVAEMLINKGADVVKENHHMYTFDEPPLHSACRNGHLALAELLLRQGAGIGTIDDSARTPLHVACEQGHLTVAEMLINKGADINDYGWYTALHIACWEGHLKVAEMLVAKGADIEARHRSRQRRPLHLACEQGHMGVAEMLVIKGADIEAKSEDRYTPLDVSDEVRQRLRAVVRQPREGPQAHHQLKFVVEHVSPETSADELALVINSLYHLESALSFEQRAGFTRALLDKLDCNSSSTLAVLIKMVHEAAAFISTTCQAGLHQSLMKRPNQGDVDRMRGMLKCIEDQLQSMSSTDLEQPAQPQQPSHQRRAEVETQQRATAVDTADPAPQQQHALHAVEAIQQQLSSYQSSLETAWNELCSKPVISLGIEDAHALTCCISNTKLKVQKFQEQRLDGQLLTQLAMTDVEQMIGLKPLGLCHRVVHCTKMAAQTPRPLLIQSDFEAGIKQLDAWLKQCKDPVSNKYRKMLINMKMDILSCGSLEISDLKALSIAPADRGKMLALLREAHRSSTAAGSGRGQLAPSWQQGEAEQRLQDPATCKRSKLQSEPSCEGSGGVALPLQAMIHK